MNFRRLSLLLALTVGVFAVSAHAQLGVYGTVNVQQVAINGKNVAPVGGGGGVYYDFKKIGRIKLGADVRASTASSRQGNFVVAHDANGNPVSFNSVGTRVHTALGGIRASTTLPVTWIKPYVQGSFGWGGSTFDPETVVDINNLEAAVKKSQSIKGGLAYEGFVGVDLRVAPIMDVRLAEFGIGAIHAQDKNHELKSISFGVVFHLP
jgi:hypothetical protein